MKRWMKWSAGGGGLFAAAVLGLCWHTGKFDGNVREVVPGKLYRSAQLDGDDLRSTVQRFGIKSVINLRGSAQGKPWYDDELSVCRELGVRHGNVNMSATRLPRPHEVRELIELVEQGPYPIMVHCMAGADRSGLASAVFLILKENKPVREAVDSQLTWHYGHVPLGATAAMGEFFELYFRHGGGKDFRTWALEDYPRIHAQVKP